MELILHDRVRYEQLYNCSAYNVSDVPLEKRQDVVNGMLFIMMFVLYELFYLPCIYSIAKHLSQACYKFMFFIGVIDVLCLFVCALLHGYLAITGSVFCSHPTLIYCAGAFGLFFWVIESSCDIILAVNRCVEMISPIWGERLYKGWRAWLWLVPVMVYGGYVLLYSMPVLFSGLYFAWFFNPHVGYIDDFGATYNNEIQNFHNWLVFIGLTSAYVLFTVVFFVRSAKGSSRVSLSQKMSFLQVLAISVVNTVCGLIYIYMQFFRISDAIIYLASYLWVTAHGLPCLIYLSMNKTIRNDFFAIFGYARVVGAAGQHALHAAPHAQRSGAASSTRVVPLDGSGGTVPSLH